jgi:hypothetical protein
VAKYEDYVKDNLDAEIDEAANESSQRQDGERIPERFKGKSAEEIARAYQELETLSGRQANELGTLRKAVETLSETRGKSEEPAKRAEKKPVTVDEIYDNADASLRRVVNEETQATQSRLEELERKLQEAERRAQVTSALVEFEKRHPNYREVLAKPEFGEWVKASPFRVRAAQMADAGDLDAADELFSTYAALNKEETEERPKTRRREAVREAGLESSGGASPAPTETFSRGKLQEMRIAARNGSPQAERWLSANGDAVRRAYEEGRIVP